MAVNTSILGQILLKSRGKCAFLNSLPWKATVLDVGCGNNSPKMAKAQRSDIYYIGLDIADYNQESPSEYANKYILADPDSFTDEILKFDGSLDAVISSHNIEHCYAPDDVLHAICKSLAPGGRLYMSFPCEESVNFPKRGGTLNFFDDLTHRTIPDFKKIIRNMRKEGLSINFASKRYRPLVLAAMGLMLEPISAFTKRNMPATSTWALYGFESVIWASRLGSVVEKSSPLKRSPAPCPLAQA